MRLTSFPRVSLPLLAVLMAGSVASADGRPDKAPPCVSPTGNVRRPGADSCRPERQFAARAGSRLGSRAAGYRQQGLRRASCLGSQGGPQGDGGTGLPPAEDAGSIDRQCRCGRQSRCRRRAAGDTQDPGELGHAAGSGPANLAGRAEPDERQPSQGIRPPQGCDPPHQYGAFPQVMKASRLSSGTGGCGWLPHATVMLGTATTWRARRRSWRWVYSRLRDLDPWGLPPLTAPRQRPSSPGDLADPSVPSDCDRDARCPTSAGRRRGQV